MISHRERVSFNVEENSGQKIEYDCQFHFKETQKPNYFMKIAVFKMFDFTCFFQPELLYFINSFIYLDGHLEISIN